MAIKVKDLKVTFQTDTVYKLYGRLKVKTSKRIRPRFSLVFN